eukprot:gene5328-5863_t
MILLITGLIGLVIIMFLFSRNSASKAGQAAISSLKVGDIAPDFELRNYQGKAFKLSSFRGEKPVVVFFYPADNTPGCTTEACTFQRLAPDFASLGAEVFGISGQGTADKERFIINNKLTAIELLIDENNDVRRAWGVPSSLFGLVPGRVTYVIDKEGRVVSVFDDLLRAGTHPEKALEALGKK